MSKISTNSYTGTRDFYPKEMRFRSFMFQQIEQAISSFSYEKISAPLLESFEIYAAKSGEEIAEKQLYVFTDKGDRRVAIRPELTPSIARMYAAKMNELPPIQRWYSIENFMRYERPQKGRLREFYQVNVDLIGAKGAFADFELLSVAQAVFSIFGATTDMYEIRINHRGFVRDVLVEYVGVNEEKFEDLARFIDKKDKMDSDKFESLMIEQGFSKDQIQRLTDVFEKDFNQLSELVPNSVFIEEIKQVFTLADKVFKEQNPLKYDFSIVRGLAYYTGLVFEAYDKNPDNTRALFGGGRYDNLVSIFQKNNNVSGVGFAIGDVTFEAFLKGHKLLTDEDLLVEKHMIAIDIKLPLSLFYTISNNLKGMENVYIDCLDMMENIILSNNDEIIDQSLNKIMDVLSKNPFFDVGDQEQIDINEMFVNLSKGKVNSYQIEIYPDTNTVLGKQLQYANKANINYVWICGIPELQRGVVKRKNMLTGKEVDFDLTTFEIY
ncbi:MAG: histidine--tRNA ligase [Brevinema sp.]